MAQTQTSPRDSDSMSGRHDSLLTALGQFVATLALDRIPEPVRMEAKLCILDTIGCIVAGADTPEAKMMLAVTQEAAGRAEASVLCTSVRLPMEAAVRVNGYMGDIFELNDLIGGHASIANVTAALALGEAQHATGADLVRAVVAGIEVTTRVYAAYYSHMKPYTEMGITPPGIPSTIGVAAVAAVLLGFDQTKTTEALAVAGALAGWCPAEVIFGDGGTVKPMLFGAWPASVGITAARYAGHGMTGPRRLLESEIGLYATLAKATNPDAILNPVSWALAQPRRKWHACCGYIHSALDVVASLRRDRQIDFTTVREIRVGLPPYIIPAVSKSRAPTSPNEARFHAEYCIALAACGADVIVPDHSLAFDKYLDREDVRAAMGKVRIQPDADLSHYHESIVDVVDADRHVTRASGKAPKGSPKNPLSRAELESKFAQLTASRLAAVARASYVERLLALESQPSCQFIFDAFK